MGLSPTGHVPIFEDVPNGVPEIVSAHAPLVRLHSKEEYWPMDAGDFVHSCSLTWATGQGTETVYVAGQTPKRPRLRVNLRRLGSRDVSAYGTRRRPFRAHEHTRPYDAGGRPAGLGIGEGFCLALAGSDAR